MLHIFTFHTFVHVGSLKCTGVHTSALRLMKFGQAKHCIDNHLWLHVCYTLQPYTPGTSPHVLKWKPSNMNSVDFKLKIVKETGMG